MLSKARFRYALLLIVFGLFNVALYNLFIGCAITDCDNLILFWISIGLLATVIISKFASPRRGRYAISLVFGPGCAVIQLIWFLQRYYPCNWNYLVCEQNEAIFQSSTAKETAQKIAAFYSIYRFCALMMLYLGGGYTLAFKQHLTWNTIAVLIAHYNAISLFLVLFLNSRLVISHLMWVLVPLALLFATELLNRIGRNSAQALVLADCRFRQNLWSNLLDNGQDVKQQITLLQSTINGGSLKSVCEPVKTKNLVPRTVLQEHTDIDRLYRDCSLLNYFFQDWVRTWFSGDQFEFCNPKAHYKKAFNIHVADCFPDIVRGPIKAPNRVISKVAFVCTFPITS